MLPLMKQKHQVDIQANSAQNSGTGVGGEADVEHARQAEPAHTQATHRRGCTGDERCGQAVDTASATRGREAGKRVKPPREAGNSPNDAKRWLAEHTQQEGNIRRRRTARGRAGQC